MNWKTGRVSTVVFMIIMSVNAFAKYGGITDEAAFVRGRTDILCAASDTPPELVSQAQYRCPAHDARKVLQTALDEAARLRV